MQSYEDIFIPPNIFQTFFHFFFIFLHFIIIKLGKGIILLSPSLQNGVLRGVTSAPYLHPAEYAHLHPAETGYPVHNAHKCPVWRLECVRMGNYTFEQVRAIVDALK